MRQSTEIGTFAPYHITHTPQRERPNILDSHPASASYSALTTSRAGTPNRRVKHRQEAGCCVPSCLQSPRLGHGRLHRGRLFFRHRSKSSETQRSSTHTSLAVTMVGLCRGASMGSLQTDCENCVLVCSLRGTSPTYFHEWHVN